MCDERTQVEHRTNLGEDEYLQRHRLFHEAQSLAGLGCFEWDVATNRVEWSDVMHEIFGLTPGEQEISFEVFLSHVVPDDREAVKASIGHALETGGSFQHDERIIRADGEIRILDSRGRVIVNQDGRPERLIGVCQDITEQRQTHRSSQWQVKGLQLLADLSAGMLKSDISLSSFQDLFSRLAEHLSCSVFTNFEMSRDDETKMSLVLSGGLPEAIVEALAEISVGSQLCGDCAKRGHLLHLPYDQLTAHPESAALRGLGVTAYVAVPIRSGDRIMGTLAFASNERTHFIDSELDFLRTVASLVAAFKARRDTDAELHQVEQRHEIVLDSVKNVIWESDATGDVFSFVSGYCQELLGFPEEKWREPGFWRARVHPEDVVDAVAYCMSKTEKHQDHRFEYRMVRADDSIVWVEDVVKVVVQQEKVVALRGAIVDITERKQLEMELRQSQKLQAIGRLAGGIAHDFNNVLTVISTYAELMQDRLSTDDVNYGSVNAIREASDRAAGLTNQLLVFSRKSVNDPQYLDLNEIVNGSEKLLRRVIGEDIVLKTRLSDGLSRIKSNKSHLEQVILNLAINARDSMPNGGNLELATRQVMLGGDAPGSELAKKGKYVELAVHDDGCGMDQETRDRCFEPFFTTKDVGVGTGLGLSVTYGVVNDAGGHIEVESEPEVGTLFRILLPAAAPEDGNESHLELNAEKTPHTGTVLLVEDEENVRKVARMTLELHGYLVMEAESGQNAIDLMLCNANTIDLLITDLVMPGMGGQELVAKLREENQALPVLYISGYGQDDLANAISIGTRDSFLQKPFSGNLLIDAVHAALANDRS